MINDFDNLSNAELRLESIDFVCVCVCVSLVSKKKCVMPVMASGGARCHIRNRCLVYNRMWRDESDEQGHAISFPLLCNQVYNNKLMSVYKCDVCSEEVQRFERR